MAFKAKIFYIHRFLSKTIREIKGRSKGRVRAIKSGYKLWLVKYHRSSAVEYAIVLNSVLDFARPDPYLDTYPEKINNHTTGPKAFSRHAMEGALARRCPRACRSHPRTLRWLFDGPVRSCRRPLTPAMLSKS
jgi:hypothetical protein